MLPYWQLTEERPRSISGVRLDGEKLVRFVYLDESGISINEAVTVVAGVIVDADKQWKAVEKGIDDRRRLYGIGKHWFNPRRGGVFCRCLRRQDGANASFQHLLARCPARLAGN